MGLKCTMPKCTRTIYAMTGLQEIKEIQKHFFKRHKIGLSMNDALEIRIDMEDGKEPNILRAMLGTAQIERKAE